MSDRQLYRIVGTVAWWFDPYLAVWAFFCDLMDAEPDEDHLQWLCEKALRIRFIPCSESD
jgi:hypothetical protein